jgi:hypothetical protein
MSMTEDRPVTAPILMAAENHPIPMTSTATAIGSGWLSSRNGTTPVSTSVVAT